jgi:integral membrane protein (TIGR01906 family)
VSRRAPLILSALVALAVPAVLLGNGLWLLTNDWYVHAEYARPGFPEDRYGLSKAERTELALVGLDSIQPLNGDGVEVLREARLPDGAAAFTEREIAHMADVRGLVGKVLLAHAIALGVIALAAAAAWLLRLHRVLARGLLGGGLLTLGIAALLGIYMLANFDDFFVQFHEALFEGDSWRFSSADTLIRLYPDAFWSDFAAVVAGFTVVEALVLSGVCWWRLRRSRARALQPAPASGDPQPSA